LDATVVSPADDLSLVHEDGSDRNATLGEALLGLLEGGSEIGICNHLAGFDCSR
jgi:hypothetical protein